MAKDTFICYAAGDKAIADAVCAALEKRGISCWMAPRDILPSTDYGEAILQAINECVLMILVLTARSNTSGFVKNEVERAFSVGKRIVQFRTEDVDLSGCLKLLLSRHQWLDASTPPIEKHLERLGEIVERLLQPAQPATPKPPTPRPPTPQPPTPPKGSGVPGGPTPGTAQPGGGPRPTGSHLKPIHVVLLIAICSVAAILLVTRPWEKQGPDSEPLSTEQRLATAQQYLRDGMHQQGLREFKDILAEYPEDAEAQLGLAIVLKHQGSLDQAIIEFRKTIALGDGDPEAYRYLGEAFEDKGELGEAVRCYRQYLEVAPEGPERERVVLHISVLSPDPSPPSEPQSPYPTQALDRGIEAFGRGDYEECIAEMNRVLDSHPDNATAGDFLARAMRQREEALEEQAAMETLQAAERSFEQADYEKCTRLLENLLSLDPHNTAASDLLDRTWDCVSHKEIAAIIGEYIRAVDTGGLLGFYRRQCSSDLYATIAGDFEDMYASYRDFQCTISDTLVLIQDNQQAEVRFTTILTGISLSDGRPKALLDGTRLWSMRREPRGWRIFEMDYRPEGAD